MKAGKTRRHGWMNEGLVSEAGREGGRWTEIRGESRALLKRRGENGRKRGEAAGRLTKRGGEKSKENKKTKV